MPSSKPRPTTLALMADAHCGHRLGMLDPATVLVDSDGPWTPELGAVQKELFKQFEGARADLLARVGGRQRIVMVHDGDLGQGAAFPHQLVSQSPKDQVAIAVALFRPWLKVPNVAVLRIMAGTDVHSMGATSIEVLVAQQLQAEFPRKDVAVRWHVRLKVAGALFDMAHHGPVAGSRTWLRGNVARLYLRDRMEFDFRRGLRVATLYVRAHRHHFLHIEDELEGVPGGCKSGLLLLPSMSGLTEHGRKVTQSAPELTTGMVFVDVLDGRIVGVDEKVQYRDLRTTEEL